LKMAPARGPSGNIVLVVVEKRCLFSGKSTAIWWKIKLGILLLDILPKHLSSSLNSLCVGLKNSMGRTFANSLYEGLTFEVCSVFKALLMF